MDLSRLLNDPRPPKRPRLFALLPGQGADSDESQATRQHSAVHLPMDMIAYVMTFVDAEARPDYRLVNQAWYAAYNRYHRHTSFIHENNMHITPSVLIATFHSYGARLRYLSIMNHLLAELVRMDSHLSTRTIPNVRTVEIYLLSLKCPSKSWLYDACHGWKRLKTLTITGYNFEQDVSIASNLNQLLCHTPELEVMGIYQMSVQPSSFPDRHLLDTLPTYAAALAHLATLSLSLEHFVTVDQVKLLLDPLHSLEGIALVDVNDLRILDAVSVLFEQPDFMPVLYSLSIITGLDLVRTPAITVQETIVIEQSSTDDIADDIDDDIDDIDDADGDAGNGVTASTEEQRTITVNRRATVIDAMNRFRDLSRPEFELRLGFLLGACSCPPAHPLYHKYIEDERQFLTDFSTKCIPQLISLTITHYTPSVSGFYWPFDALFHNNATSFQWTTGLVLNITPQAWFKDRLSRILNDRNLLPRLGSIGWYSEEATDVDIDALVRDDIDKRDGALSIEYTEGDPFGEMQGEVENGTYDWIEMSEQLAQLEQNSDTDEELEDDATDTDDNDTDDADTDDYDMIIA
ncbi:hypothetical protein GQ42DRAFT_177782 [Ramicandelaber brevisporus]|nr:hypothetical protein GQ42DRAFT_177782 [Ramicandelaber brevisporus]